MYQMAYDMIEKSSMTGFEREKGICLSVMGFSFMNLGSYDIAIGLCEKALDMLKLYQDTNWEQADCYETIARAYTHLGKPEEAKKWTQKICDVFVNGGSKLWRDASVFEDIGHNAPYFPSKKKSWWKFW